MAAISLKTRILKSFFVITMVLSLLIGLLGLYVIKKDIIDREQVRVASNLKAARSVYISEINRIGEAFRLVLPGSDFSGLKEKLRLDYLEVVDIEEAEKCRSDIVKACAEQGKGIGGTRIIAEEELQTFGRMAVERARIDIEFTPRAKPTSKKFLTDAMSKEYAVIVPGENGGNSRIVYGGRIINQDGLLVDRIRELVFGNELYESRPIGTVTIFQDDTRVSTNVLTDEGARAIGTRVSEEVYEKVIEEGKTWQDRAFVVNDWYKTAYEPIKNVKGQIIGILYVGILEKPFDDMARNILLIFLAIVCGAAALTVVLSFVLAGGITKPLTEMLGATRKLSGGDLGYEVKTETGVIELNKLAESFNEMSLKLNEREQSLKESNEKLIVLNKSYIDLIGFVAHELKGILASAVLNAYSIRDGFLGMINFKQRKAIDSITRNLDYLGATVRKFLNLGSIERGDLKVNKTEFSLKQDVFDVSIESLAAIAVRKNLTVNNMIDPEMIVKADSDLLQIVANNLVSNAIKYGHDKGEIRITSRVEGPKVEVEVYNDSSPITDEQKELLFKKFSRLKRPDTKKIKGTGLGLYITKQVIESHGGRIWVETRACGNSFIFQIERGL